MMSKLDLKVTGEDILSMKILYLELPIHKDNVKLSPLEVNPADCILMQYMVQIGKES